MGIYYIIANDAKREYIDPHDLGGGAKFLELFGSKASDALLWLLWPHGQQGMKGRWNGDAVRLVPDCTGSYEAVVFGRSDPTGKHFSGKYRNISDAVTGEMSEFWKERRQ